MHTLNLHLLRIFFTVAEQGSFSQAALALHISQPAVSKGVRELEQQLGLALVERGAPSAPRTLRLTESGAALHAHARGIFALERAALDDIRARIGLQRGRLVVGASSTIAGYWLPAQIAAFTQQHPHVDLEICGGNTQSIVQALLDGALDMALIEAACKPRTRLSASPARTGVMTGCTCLPTPHKCKRLRSTCPRNAGCNAKQALARAKWLTNGWQHKGCTPRTP